jgi:hypothetical protein
MLWIGPPTFISRHYRGLLLIGGSTRAVLTPALKVETMRRPDLPQAKAKLTGTTGMRNYFWAQVVTAQEVCNRL